MDEVVIALWLMPEQMLTLNLSAHFYKLRHSPLTIHEVTLILELEAAGRLLQTSGTRTTSLLLTRNTLLALGILCKRRREYLEEIRAETLLDRTTLFALECRLSRLWAELNVLDARQEPRPSGDVQPGGI